MSTLQYLVVQLLPILSHGLHKMHLPTVIVHHSNLEELLHQLHRTTKKMNQ